MALLGVGDRAVSWATYSDNIPACRGVIEKIEGLFVTIRDPDTGKTGTYHHEFIYPEEPECAPTFY